MPVALRVLTAVICVYVLALTPVASAKPKQPTSPPPSVLPPPTPPPVTLIDALPEAGQKCQQLCPAQYEEFTHSVALLDRHLGYLKDDGLNDKLGGGEPYGLGYSGSASQLYMDLLEFHRAVLSLQDCPAADAKQACEAVISPFFGEYSRINNSFNVSPSKGPVSALGLRYEDVARAFGPVAGPVIRTLLEDVDLGTHSMALSEWAAGIRRVPQPPPLQPSQDPFDRVNPPAPVEPSQDPLGP